MAEGQSDCQVFKQEIQGRIEKAARELPEMPWVVQVSSLKEKGETRGTTAEEF